MYIAYPSNKALAWHGSAGGSLLGELASPHSLRHLAMPRARPIFARIPFHWIPSRLRVTLPLTLCRTTSV